MMRVIAGLYKGRPLTAPKGSNTRPTTDRVKESLMSTLLSLRGSLDGAYVLDAFAGSGALGIECLSRGAASAHFFERDRAALAALRENIEKLKIPSEQARVFRSDIMKNPPLIGAVSYDIVFLDPPYAYSFDDVVGLVLKLKERGRIAQDCVISYEHAVEDDLAAFFAKQGIETDILASKRFATTVIDLVQFR